MTRDAPHGITPPTPGLEHEEPEFAIEDDIPSDDRHGTAASERRQDSTERPASGKLERE